MNDQIFVLIKNIFKIFKVTFFVFVCEIGYGQEIIKSKKESAVDSIPFQITSHNNIVISAVLNKTDTLNLMFHTAANSITLTTKATKRTKSIKWNGKNEVSSWGGKNTSRHSKNNTIEIGKLKRDSLAVWEDENSGSKTDGKFGPNLFQGYAIEIDFDNNVIILHESLPKKVKEYFKMPLQGRNDNLYIQGTSTIGGVGYNNQFLIHSGYGGALLYDDKFVTENKIGELIETTEEKELKDSFGNVLKIKKGIIPVFKLGNLKISDVPVGFLKGKIGKQQISVIGMELLKQFNIIISEKRNIAFLKPNLNINSTF